VSSPTAVSISLSKFTEAVQAAVKAAVSKHPKFKIEAPAAITVSYLIRGIPIPEALLSNATIAETQAVADDVAAHISGVFPEALAGPGRKSEGAIISVGRHVIIGIPPVAQTIRLEK
jgi:hypothetical protein